MTIPRSLAWIGLGLAMCVGCGESGNDAKVQSWESKKSTAATEKTNPPTSEDKSTAPGGASADPHGMFNPHGNMPGMAASAGSAATIENTGKLDLPTDGGKLAWTVPKKWVRKQPRMGMIQAEYALPKAEGDPADGRMTVMFAGGSIEDNVKRWKGQFEKLDKQDTQSFDAGGLKVSQVDFSGTFAEGMMGPTVSRPDYRMIGAIYQVGEQLLFIKCYGPAKTMGAAADDLKGFIRSLKVEK